MKHRFFAALIVAFSFPALANSFQHQTDAGFGWVESDAGDYQQWALSQRVYLTPVSRGSRVPYAEASFISRSSSIQAGYNYAQFDSGSAKSSVSSWTLGGEYKDISHNFYVAANVIELNGTADTVVLGSLGYYVRADWLVKLDARNIRPDSVGSYTEYGVSTKKLLALENGNFINIEARFMDVKQQDDSEYGVAADYYFGRSIALGLAYDWTSDDVVITDTDSVTVRGSWYLQPSFALRAAVVFDYLDSDEELYQLGASYRF